MSSPPENADEETQNREIPTHIISRETQNKEIPTHIISRETQNREIPTDVILTKILPRLSAIPLLRFKWVCKEWQLFISSNKFIIHHARYRSSRPSRSVLSISPNSTLTAFDYGDSRNVQIINFGQCSTTNPMFLIGSCNGLVLLICCHVLNVEIIIFCQYFPEFELLFRSGLLNFGFDYRVYNPVLKRYVVIRQPQEFVLESNHLAGKDCSFGFGCVSTQDHMEFFIVAINFRMRFVLVYESSSGNWVPLQTLPRNPPILFEDAWYIHSGTLVNQALHWGVSFTMLGLGCSIKCIAAFNLVSRRSLKYMELPSVFFGEPDFVRSAFSLCCVSDRLCAWAYHNGRFEVEMWMMKEYDVKESWTRLFRGNMSFEYWNCCGLAKANEVMMFTFNWLVLVDFSSQVPLERRLVGFGPQETAVNYVQSLISPHTVFLYGEQNG